MRLRSFLGLLLAAIVLALALHWARENTALLAQPFRIGETATIPLSGALAGAFLLGFLPFGVALVAQTLRRDLKDRVERKRQRETESLAATLRRAVDLERDGQLARAAVEYESFLAGRPDDFAGLLAYGGVLRQLGRAEESGQVLRRASALFPHSVAIEYALAEAYLEKGDEDVAREIQGRILRDYPGLGLEAVRRRRSEALGRQDWNEAAKLHERATAILAEGGDAASLARESSLAQGLDYQRGVGLLERERPGEAAEIFRRLLAHERRFVPARIMLGEALLLDNRASDAVAEWRNGYLETGSPVFLQRIEDHFIEHEDPVAAIETLRGLIAQATNDLLPRFFLGRLYYRLEMLDEAQRELRAVEERIRTSPTFHFLLGRILERRGEMAKAIESYLACLRQLELGNTEYLCSVCRTRYADWHDYCSRCGSWNSVDLDFEEERLSPEQLGVQPVPVWGAADDSGEFAIPITTDRDSEG